MTVAIIILLLAFLLVILGFATENYFFTLSGGLLIIISGLLFLADPLSVSTGSIINQTSENVYTVSNVYTSPSPLLNHSFNLVLLLIGMMFMYNSYIRLREEKYEEDYK